MINMMTRTIKLKKGHMYIRRNQLDAVDVHYFYNLLKSYIQYFEKIKKTILESVPIQINETELLFDKKKFMSFGTTTNLIKFLIDEFELEFEVVYINGIYSEEPYTELSEIQFMELE